VAATNQPSASHELPAMASMASGLSCTDRSGTIIGLDHCAFGSALDQKTAFPDARQQAMAMSYAFEGNCNKAVEYEQQVSTSTAA
jgi:hypothetical protein